MTRYATSLVVGSAMVVAGFAAFAIGWGGAAATLDVSTQLPFVVSSGFGGLALIVVGSVVVVLQVWRRQGAVEAELHRRLMAEVQALRPPERPRRARASRRRG